MGVLELTPELKIKVDDDTNEKLADIMDFQKLTLEDIIKSAANEYHVPNTPVDREAFAHTVQFLPIMLDQIRQNLPYILNDKSLSMFSSYLQAVKKRGIALVIAGGPSLDEKQLRTIRTSDFQKRGGTIIVVDSVLHKVVAAGIVPDAVVTIDRQLETAEFFKHGILRNFKSPIHCIMPIDIHPETRDLIKGERWWFKLAFLNYPTTNLNAYLQFLMPQLPTLLGGGNVGSACINISLMLGMKTVGFCGMNYSWPTSMRTHETDNFLSDVIMHGGRIITNRRGKFVRIDWPCKLDNCPDEEKFKGECAARRVEDEDFKLCQEEFDSQFNRVKDPFGVEWLISNTYSVYRDILIDHLTHFKEQDPELRFVNCTGGGLAYDDESEVVEVGQLSDFLKETGREPDGSQSKAK